MSRLLMFWGLLYLGIKTPYTTFWMILLPPFIVLSHGSGAGHSDYRLGRLYCFPRSAGTVSVPGYTFYFLIQVWVPAPTPTSWVLLWDWLCLLACSLLIACCFLNWVLFCTHFLLNTASGNGNHLVFLVVKGLLTFNSSPVQGTTGAPVSTAVRSYGLAATGNTGLFISPLFSSLGGWKPGLSPTWKPGISQWEKAQHACRGQWRMAVSTRNRSNDHLRYF